MEGEPPVASPDAAEMRRPEMRRQQQMIVVGALLDNAAPRSQTIPALMILAGCPVNALPSTIGAAVPVE